jgi:hypothetical protein
MADLHRRDVVQLLAVAPLAAAFDWTPDDTERARAAAGAARAAAATNGTQFDPAFFTPHEYRTVRLLVDIILPADERSGSATEAGVPEFMDFIVADQSGRQTAMRGGLAWLDVQSLRRHNATFFDSTEEERYALLDEIAWPDKARPEMSHGVAFFNSFRDLTASGFFSSRMGVDDLRYQGNTFVADWNGCPPEALDKFGVSYDEP